jgi:RHS repeat-associated protein
MAATPVGENVYGFDLDGRLVEHRLYRHAESWGASDLATHYELTYDNASRVSRVLGAGRDVRYGWRDDGLVRSHEVLKQVGPSAWLLAGRDTVLYDETARIREFIHESSDLAIAPVQSFKYEYDLRSQVRRATAQTLEDGVPPVNHFDLEYGFDQSWNMTSITDHLAGTTRTFEVDGNDELLPDAEHAYAWDGNGNLLADGTRAFTWDALSRLTRVQAPGVDVSHAYDPFGRLIAESVSGGPRTWRWYQGWTLDVARQEGATEPAVKYAHAGGMQPSGHLPPGGGTFVDYDENAQGSRVLLEPDYRPLWDPFGNPAGSDVPADSRIGFQGQEWRADAGLYYMRHRWYDPEIGRFVSVDPMLQDTVNNYNFVLNDPINGTDPIGLWSPPDHEWLIRRAFPKLTPAQRRILNEASANADAFFPGQMPSMAYTHAMSGRWVYPLPQHFTGQLVVDEDPEEAQRKYDDFLANKQRLATDPCISLGGGLYEFGLGLHAVADSTSPTHVGFQPWPTNPLMHAWGERRMSSTDVRRTLRLMRQYYRSTFGRTAW